MEQKELTALRQELKADIAALRDETRRNIDALRRELKDDIAVLRGDHTTLWRELTKEIATRLARFDHLIEAVGQLKGRTEVLAARQLNRLKSREVKV